VSKVILPVLSLILNFVVLLILLSRTPATSWLSLIVSWTVLVLVSFGGFVVLGRMIDGDIDLSLLLTETGGSGASLSRFQLLIFTFVISLSLFLIVISGNPPGFPKTIPPEILTLLGISASTYAVSKGIQASNPAMKKMTKDEAAAAAQQPQQQQQQSPPVVKQQVPQHQQTPPAAGPAAAPPAGPPLK
jgi:hypothetical protein